MSADTILFHPSALGKIMSGTGKGWTVENSQTCKKELVKIYRETLYGREYIHSNKYTEKGIKQEQDSISLYARIKKRMFKKNEKRITDNYFTGEPDIIYYGKTVDIKTSWSLETFPHPLTDSADSDYELQGLAYMELTGAREHIIAYCLVNAPGNLVIKEKEKLWYSMNCPDETDGRYISERIRIEKNMIFDQAQFLKDNPSYDFDCKEWTFDIPKE